MFTAPNVFPTPLPTKVHEPIRVAVDFIPANAKTSSKVIPLAFMWAQKKYVVKKVNLVYKRRQGTRNLWCFAVSDTANSYVLLYDPESLQWTLDELYTL